MGGMGGGMFNIAPKKSVRESVRTVCLEHGKKEPSSRVKYDVKPIGEVVERPEVALLCAQIGTGRMNQAAGQAAVWHVNNDIPWQYLATKTTRPMQGHAFVQSYFSPQQLMVAQNSVGMLEKFVKDNKVEFKSESNGTTSEDIESESDELASTALDSEEEAVEEE